jgi:hypothetical protein
VTRWWQLTVLTVCGVVAIVVGVRNFHEPARCPGRLVGDRCVVGTSSYTVNDGRRYNQVTGVGAVLFGVALLGYSGFAVVRGIRRRRIPTYVGRRRMAEANGWAFVPSISEPPTVRYGLVGGTINGLRFELYDFREDGRTPATAWIVYLPPGAPDGFRDWSQRRTDAKPVGPLIESVTVTDRSIMNVSRGWRGESRGEEVLTGPLRLLAKIVNRYVEDP